MIVLKSCDGESFEVEEAVALESTTIKHMIEDDCADNGIPLPNVTGKILAKVVEYCKKHVEVPTTQDSNTSGANSNGAATNGGEEDLKSWDTDFVKVDQATLFDLILVGIVYLFAWSKLGFEILIWKFWLYLFSFSNTDCFG